MGTYGPGTLPGRHHTREQAGQRSATLLPVHPSRLVGCTHSLLEHKARDASEVASSSGGSPVGLSLSVGLSLVSESGRPNASGSSASAEGSSLGDAAVRGRLVVAREDIASLVVLLLLVLAAERGLGRLRRGSGRGGRGLGGVLLLLLLLQGSRLVLLDLGLSLSGGVERAGGVVDGHGGWGWVDGVR